MDELDILQEMKTVLKTICILILGLFSASCDKFPSKPVLLGEYEAAKVSVSITHVPSMSGGGGDIDTDQGVSERELWGEGSSSGKTAGHYFVKKVTSTGYTLDYKIAIENPLESAPRPFNGSILIPYNESVTQPITDDYTITVSTRKP